MWLVGKLFKRKIEILDFLAETSESTETPVEQSVEAEVAMEAEMAPASPRKVITTTIPASVWASTLSARGQFHELATVFRRNSYHARTDTAEEKKQLAKEILLQQRPQTVEPLLDMISYRDETIPEIAELLIEIDDPAAAPHLRQLYEMRTFDRAPAGIESYIDKHLGAD